MESFCRGEILPRTLDDLVLSTLASRPVSSQWNVVSQKSLYSRQRLEGLLNRVFTPYTTPTMDTPVFYEVAVDAAI